jgi:large subunit ribosomal protein L10
MISENKVVREKPIPEEKTKLVKEISDKMKESRTVLIASCKGLPGKQFHDIKKKLRGKADFQVAKKSALERAIDGVDKGAIKNLKKEVGADVVIFFSDMNPFELSGLLSDSQSPSKAREGDIAPADITIEPGPTELIPGPAISELGSVGLKVAVKDGKLEIQKGTVVAKEGDKIESKVAGVLAKLDIKPMKVGFLPIAAYDKEEDKVYVGIKIDKEGTLDELKDLIGKALGFAVNIDYVVKETITYFIAKASAEEKALEGLVEKGSGEKAEEFKAEESSGEEEKTEESVEGGEEKPAEVTEEKVAEEIAEEVKGEIKPVIPKSPETKTLGDKEDAAEKIAEEVKEEVKGVAEDIVEKEEEKTDDDKNTKEDA